MLHCSLPQALSVWADLEDAYRGEHGYGGHTAEIYAYRLVGHKPSAMADCTFGTEARREHAEQASQAMAALLVMFMDRRQCKIMVDGKRFRSKLGPEPHRFHIEIEPV